MKKQKQDPIEDYIKKLAKRRIERYEWQGSWHSCNQRELEQEGFLGLFEAKQQFAASKFDCFETFARKKVRQRMYRYCLANEPLLSASDVIKRASNYISRIHAILERRSLLSRSEIEAIVSAPNHPLEASLSKSVRDELRTVKAKIERAAKNSRSTYSRLVLKSRELAAPRVVPLEDLPENNLPSQMVSLVTPEIQISAREDIALICKLMSEREAETLSLRLQGYEWNEVPALLAEAGYVNSRGEALSIRGIQAAHKKAFERILGELRHEERREVPQ